MAHTIPWIVLALVRTADVVPSDAGATGRSPMAMAGRRSGLRGYPLAVSTGVSARPPTVSIVLNYHDRPLYLDEAIRSVLEQTFHDWELLLVDGGSQPPAEIDERTRADPRVRVIRLDEDPGYQAATMIGWSQARGRYLTNLHDDNAFEPTFLERLVAPLDADPNLVAAFSDHWWIRPNGEIDRELTERETRAWGRADLAPGRHEPFLEHAVIAGSVPIVMSTIIRRDAIDWAAVPPRSGIVFDLWLAYAIAATDRGAWYVPERLARYRVHEERLTRTGGVTLSRSFLYCWRLFLADPRLARHADELRTRIREGQGNLALGLMHAGDARGARREARLGLRKGFDARLAGILLLGASPPRIRELAFEAREWPWVRERLGHRRASASRTRRAAR
jgi:glycosyltransferase involved in cell wall biosynthesis